MKHRTYKLASGKVIHAGRNSLDNDLLVDSSRVTDVLLHTEEPGSPFVNVGENPTKEEVYEASIFCAKYSQTWRDKKADVIINKFLRSDMKKDNLMKEGTWGVKKSEKVKVKKEDILRFEETLKK